MNFDVCCDCHETIDVTKRIYRGPGGKPRCPLCQVLVELRLEVVRVTTLADLLDDMDEGRLVH